MASSDWSIDHFVVSSICSAQDFVSLESFWVWCSVRVFFVGNFLLNWLAVTSDTFWLVSCLVCPSHHLLPHIHIICFSDVHCLCDTNILSERDSLSPNGSVSLWYIIICFIYLTALESELHEKQGLYHTVPAKRRCSVSAHLTNKLLAKWMKKILWAYSTIFWELVETG